MRKSIQSRLESLETVMPPSYRPPDGFGVLGLAQHMAELPPAKHDACIQSLTDDELERFADELRQMLGADALDQCKARLRQSIAADGNYLKEQGHAEHCLQHRCAGTDRADW